MEGKGQFNFLRGYLFPYQKQEVKAGRFEPWGDAVIAEVADPGGLASARESTLCRVF